MKKKEKKKKRLFPVLSQLVIGDIKAMTSGHLNTTIWASGSGFRHLGRVVVFALKPEPLVSGIFQETVRLFVANFKIIQI